MDVNILHQNQTSMEGETSQSSESALTIFLTGSQVPIACLLLLVLLLYLLLVLITTCSFSHACRTTTLDECHSVSTHLGLALKGCCYCPCNCTMTCRHCLQQMEDHCMLYARDCRSYTYSCMNILDCKCCKSEKKSSCCECSNFLPSCFANPSSEPSCFSTCWPASPPTVCTSSCCWSSMDCYSSVPECGSVDCCCVQIR